MKKEDFFPFKHQRDVARAATTKLATLPKIPHANKCIRFDPARRVLITKI